MLWYSIACALFRPRKTRESCW